MRCVHGPCISALHVCVALTVPGCVHVCLHFAVCVGSSGVCMFHVLILMSILVLNCEVLWANLAGLGAMLYKIKSFVLLLLLYQNILTL